MRTSSKRSTNPTFCPLNAHQARQGALLSLCLLATACGDGAGAAQNGGSPTQLSGGDASGGAADSGGTTSGGMLRTGGAVATGGAAESGGTTSGGSATSGGTASGGMLASGGTASGGDTNSGGTASGGVLPSGGTASGGSLSGGSEATGGAGGAGGAPVGRFCEEPLPTGAPLATYAASATTIPNTTFLFLEGPVWLDEAGVLLFSEMDFSGAAGDGPPSKIVRFTPPDQIDVFVPQAGQSGSTSGSNGLALALDGSILAGTHDTQSVSQYDYPSGTRTQIVSDPPGVPTEFNSPNDLTLRSDGTLYFTDPNWQRDGRAGTGSVTGLYARAPSGNVVLLDGSLPQPNGVTLSPDETVLYVSAVDGQVYRFPVNSDGTLGDREVFASPGSPDGMTVDCAGHLYVASNAGTVFVYAPDGTTVAEIASAPSTTNVAFGGPDHRTLYITADGALQSIELAHPGAPY